MRALVTGAKGMMGTDLCLMLSERGYECLATDINNMDVREPVQVEKQFSSFRPEIAFHLAALTDVDLCERESMEAFRTNTVGTQNVALACQNMEIPMVYISTISVFDGTKNEPYTEFDTPNPQSWYSRSKYEGEKIVQQLLQRYYIIRAGWMFGGGVRDKKFVAKILELAAKNSEIKIVNDKFGSPTYTRDISRAVIRISETGWYGLYHAVNTGQQCSRYEFAQKIITTAGIKSCKLTPVSSAVFPLAAPRPRMEAAINLHSQLMGLDLMPPWEDALMQYISRYLIEE